MHLMYTILLVYSQYTAYVESVARVNNLCEIAYSYINHHNIPQIISKLRGWMYSKKLRLFEIEY